MKNLLLFIKKYDRQFISKLPKSVLFLNKNSWQLCSRKYFSYVI